MIQSKKANPAAALALAMVFPCSANAATMVVDWLELAPGGSAASFSLVADGGLPAASGALAIDSGKGISFPNFPQSRVFNAGSWMGATGYVDSIAGDDRVSGFDLRVVSQSGPSAYTVTLDVPAGLEMVVAIGGLHRGLAGFTGSLTVAASGGGAISIDGAWAWTGTDMFDQEIAWDPVPGTLRTTAGSDGESEVAFLRVGPLSGTNPQLTFRVPDGYGGAGTTGDSISIAIGTVIPEPGMVTLAALGVAFLCASRRR